MKTFMPIFARIKALAKQTNRQGPIVAQCSTEYQKFVAAKAADLLALMQVSDLKSRFLEMQDFLRAIQACRVALPNPDLTGWSWYFLYENPERLDLKYPEICKAIAGLGHVMDYDSFKTLQAREPLYGIDAKVRSD